MDEPTAVLAPQEIDELFRTLRSMTADGRSVVFISHKLGEVMAIADRITVMRRGVVTAAGIARRPTRRGPTWPGGWSAATCSRSSSGRRSSPGEVVLAVRDVAADNDRGLPALRGRVARRPGGRDRRHRRRRRQRPERAGRGHHRRCGRADGSVTIGGERGGQPARSADAIRAGRRPRARGPDRGRQRARTCRSPTT